MEEIETIKDLEILCKYEPDNPGLKRIITEKVNDLIERVCLDSKICPICGKELNPNGGMRTSSDMSNRMYKVAMVDICSDDMCKYNRLVEARNTISENEYVLNGGKKRHLHLGDIDLGDINSI